MQARDGSEAYTRDGSFRISADGELQTRGGLPVLGEGGPISFRRTAQVTIGTDGTVSATDLGQSAANVSAVGRIKLVNPARTTIVTRQRRPVPHARRRGRGRRRTPAVDSSGALEDSNVNAVDSMVDMINLARQFDLHMKMLQTRRRQRAARQPAARPQA